MLSNILEGKAISKILLIAPKYSIDKNDQYLTNEIANELCSRGIRVTVLALSNKCKFEKNNLIDEKVIAINSSVKYLKYILIWWKLTFELIKLILSKQKFNQIIMFGPLLIMGPSAFLLRFLCAQKKTVVIFDFFPAHQIQINSIPNWIEKILKFSEVILLNSFNEAVVMGRRNKFFAETYYEKSKAIKAIKIINLWGPSGDKEYALPYKDGPVKMIFGGQMINGRKIEELIEMLKVLRAKNINVEIDFYSSGLYFERLAKKHFNDNWINFMSSIPRDLYKKTLSNYHIGIIVTDPLAQLPAFPSKIIDYVQANLFVLAIVEKESEMVDIFSGFKRVHLNFFEFNQVKMLELAAWLESVKQNVNTFECEEMQHLFKLDNAVDVLVG